MPPAAVSPARLRAPLPLRPLPLAIYDETNPNRAARMCRQMPEFSYTDLLPLGEDTTDYRLVAADGLTRRHAFGKNFLEVDPGVLTLLTQTAMRDIAHLLRPGHLRQLRSILDDPQASANDRFVA